MDRVWGCVESRWKVSGQRGMGRCNPGVGREHGRLCGDLAGPRWRRYPFPGHRVESRWKISGQWELSTGGAGVGGDDRYSPVGVEVEVVGNSTFGMHIVESACTP